VFINSHNYFSLNKDDLEEIKYLAREVQGSVGNPDENLLMPLSPISNIMQRRVPDENFVILAESLLKDISLQQVLMTTSMQMSKF
jgi:hypothetical protein